MAQSSFEQSRRSFIAAFSTAAFTVAFRPSRHCVNMRVHGRHGGHGDHPTPRPGRGASHVLSPDIIAEYPGAASAYDGVRQIPEVIDGLRCHCGCKDIPGYYSLLTCYEEGRMATMCEICQGQGRLAYRLHRSSKTLDEIRAAIDARFG